MTGVDPTASVDPGASLASDVEVGPYAVIDAGVTLESGCVVGPHAVIRGETHIGAGTRVFQFASVGEIPQDKKYRGEASRLEIGRDNTIREFVTINRGTEEGGGVTRIGDGNWIMAYVHIAHDCIVGNQAVFANGASLAGHVTIGDGATLGGFTLVHQFCRLGRGSFSSMGSCIRRDVPPWVMVAGDPARPHGINTEGLRRLGYESEAQMRLRNAYRTLYKKGLRLQEALRALESEAGEDAAILELVEFVTHSERGIVR
ncbi:acyl-ACP--UDP-N-acetylglucosamine O-acyltransferase [Spiribacter sp. 2438]|uniref:acyl-ACP--UDP-N-acetylglucosamine O-acyltransferase n=1 Tax=Spiribacter sp. 2438 TaxID=2666185 RepID=UPI0012AFACD5|nr:acyl-ACP--UDP-N-acetylglucosamine O-acyltransferase [Spiribacter sp. 2438]QGM21654.1 acyl-ACP--UDP-N-acetylglucosamine O-acyltransferase [Spiribacter sp. 2438]